MNANGVLSWALRRLIRFEKWTFYYMAQSAGPDLNWVTGWGGERKKKKKKVTKGEWAGNTGTQSVALQHPGPPRCSSALFQLRSSLIFWHGRLKWFSIDKSDNNGLGDWMENRCLPQQHYQRRTGFVRAAGSPSWSLGCTCSDATSHCSERTNRDTLGIQPLSL